MFHCQCSPIASEKKPAVTLWHFSCFRAWGEGKQAWYMLLLYVLVCWNFAVYFLLFCAWHSEGHFEILRVDHSLILAGSKKLFPVHFIFILVEKWFLRGQESCDSEIWHSYFTFISPWTVKNWNFKISKSFTVYSLHEYQSNALILIHSSLFKTYFSFEILEVHAIHCYQ